MAKNGLFPILQQEIDRLDSASISKRREKVITGFTQDSSPKAIIAGLPRRIFNSNDYLGLRFHPALKEAEQKASEMYGTGPGAVRFISGSLGIYWELEQALASFHHRPAAQVFSSAFATNLAVVSSLLKGQSQDSLISSKSAVFSDQLNHRSIVDAIRLSGLTPEQKFIYPHLDVGELDRQLSQNAGKFERVLVITDGVFSMLGEIAPLSQLRTVIDKHQDEYPQGVLLVVDDCHGIGVLGKSGRGTEEDQFATADILIGTLGKAFGTDGGYVVGEQVVIDYLHEAAATYIYSNPFSPGTAGAALAAVNLLNSPLGEQLLAKSRSNTVAFKKAMSDAGFTFAAPSFHPIQPVLVGDPGKAQALTAGLFDAGFLVTAINYPVVPKGRDEIRVQISAIHTEDDLSAFVTSATEVAHSLSLL